MTYRTATNVTDGLQALWTCIEVYDFCNSPLRISLTSQNSDGFVRCTHDVVFQFERIPNTTRRSPSYEPFGGLPPVSVTGISSRKQQLPSRSSKFARHKSQMRRNLENAFRIRGTLGISSSLNIDEQMQEVG